MSGPHPEQAPPYGILQDIISTLNDNNLTAFGALLQKANASALPTFYSNTANTATIFAPVNDACMYILPKITTNALILALP